MSPDPLRRCASDLLHAVEILLHHPVLAEHLAQGVRTTSLALATALPLPPDHPRLHARLDRCEEALQLCACQLGLCPPVAEALGGAQRLRQVLRLLATRPAIRNRRPPRTVEPAAGAAAR